MGTAWPGSMGLLLVQSDISLGAPQQIRETDHFASRASKQFKALLHFVWFGHTVFHVSPWHEVQHAYVWFGCLPPPPPSCAAGCMARPVCLSQAASGYA